MLSLDLKAEREGAKLTGRPIVLELLGRSLEGVSCAGEARRSRSPDPPPLSFCKTGEFEKLQRRVGFITYGFGLTAHLTPIIISSDPILTMSPFFLTALAASHEFLNVMDIQFFFLPSPAPSTSTISPMRVKNFNTSECSAAGKPKTIIVAPEFPLVLAPKGVVEAERLLLCRVLEVGDGESGKKLKNNRGHE